MTVVLWLSAPWMLDMFGATGKARDIGITYVQIVILCLPVLVLSMSSGALLRAIGAKQRAMWSKMAGAAVNAVLDPIFIFGFDWGVEGAAWATVVSRIVGLFDANLFRKDIRDIARVTVPVGLAKVGPPIASAFIMSSMAKYGPDAVAAMAIIERIAPFVFVGYMALPQAIGPIIGQNFAAAKAERVRSIWHNVWALVAVYGVIVCAALFLFQSQIAVLFSATDQTTAYLSIFCSFTAPFYMFLGLQFSSHTFFNVTGRPNLAMIFDLAKELLGVIPLVWLGSYYLGATGVLFGQAAGIVLFGTITGIVSYRLARRMGGI
jgi:Na+-driven multidrug efflux pump